MNEIKELRHDFNQGLPIITIMTAEGFVHGQLLPYSSEATQLYVHDIEVEQGFRHRGAAKFLLRAFMAEGRQYNPQMLGGAAVTPEGQAFFGRLFDIDFELSNIFAVPFAHAKEVLASSL